MPDACDACGDIAHAVQNGQFVAMNSPQDEQRQREAREILERAERDSGTVWSGALQSFGARMASHFSARDGEAADSVEIWAKRIGRALAVVFFFALVINLFTGWLF